ncbi:hypothetical protein H5407_23090 [Mitsuaria sp. WAJ17]|uniref:DUF7674 family protein n=1 Tax=Mitsuaria sp. WAJ17 TaxID=2761452 RepID=UPI001601ECA6|nr:hypothetical protein [Mitsuaria sp. WAJ17]MBB2488123.1 hypothetical protein [Mitsuaria sp. WAJ17]
MDIDPSVRALLLGIMRTFPDVGKRMKRCAREIGGVSFATTRMMNEFSSMTSEAIRERNEKVAREHLAYVSRLLAEADDKVHEYIAVYYMEDLVYDLDEKSKKWGWTIIPEDLRALYVAMWGQPRFL